MLSSSVRISRASPAFRAINRSICSVVHQPSFSNFCVTNEQPYHYCVGSFERECLKFELCRVAGFTEEIPIVIGGEFISQGEKINQPMPHCLKTNVAQFYHADDNTIQKAIDVAVQAQLCWDRWPVEERVRIWLCAADLMAGTYRQCLNAATMLGQGKTVIQAELDAACELIDHFRYNAFFLKENAKYQPLSEARHITLNSMRFRGIDGFVAAITPFNYTSIAGNLAYTPALMGNCVVWKPDDRSILSSWIVFNILRQAGLPDGVVNFVPADMATFGKAILNSPHLAGVNYNGNGRTFNKLWCMIGQDLTNYRNYPRLVGECGGKGFHFVHCSANLDTVVSCTIRAAFEYSGQKNSACTRLYIPRSLYYPIVQGLLCERSKLKVGNPQDFTVFTGAVIDEKAFKRCVSYIKAAKENKKNTILGGGTYNKKEGFFVNPTIIETKDPNDRLMKDDIMGPILTIFMYEDQFVYQVLQAVGTTTSYAMSGSVFANDECFLAMALDCLYMAAGNIYVNDKCTGSIVNQQPYGGGRMSGTNDKTGGPGYVLRWTSPQAIKETFRPMHDIEYAYMKE